MNFSQFGPEDDRYRAFFAAGESTVDWVMEHCARENLTAEGLGAKIWAYADDGTIIGDEATRLVRALLSAGLDTTVIALGNTIRCLAAHPEAWTAVHENPRLMKFAIDEALRFDSPFQSFFRTTSREVEIAGARLPADSKLVLFMGAANRDPRRWGPDAEEFRIDRGAGGHLTFGMGIHQCVGQPITRLEAEVLLTELATRVSRLELTGPPEPFLHNTLRGWTSVPVRVTPA